MSIPKEITSAIKALKNDRHRKFVAAYIKGIAVGKPNAADAYRKAGYNPKDNDSAASCAEQVLRRLEIKAIVDLARASAEAASTAEVEGAIGDLAWKRQKLIEITDAGLAKLKLKKGDVEIEGGHFDLKVSVSAIGLLARIDGDEKPLKFDVGLHESILERLA